jgi:hypothetical protein
MDVSPETSSGGTEQTSFKQENVIAAAEIFCSGAGG